MIDLNTPNEWQHRDPETGLLFPWYTKSLLDELVTWDLKEKVVFEYGAGASTLWWASRCKRVAGVEYDQSYSDTVNLELSQRHTQYSRSWPVSWYAFKEPYINCPLSIARNSDIIIIDGEPIAWRDDCVKPAIECLKPGGRLIIDNWMQPSVGWMPSEETQALMTALPHIIYSQAGHPDWKTLLATKP